MTDTRFTYTPGDECVDAEFTFTANQNFSVQVCAYGGSTTYAVNEHGYNDPEAMEGFWLKYHGEHATLQSALDDAAEIAERAEHQARWDNAREITQAEWDAKPGDYKTDYGEGRCTISELDRASGATVSVPVRIIPEAGGFENARRHLREEYFAPAPSQFIGMPRAMDRCDPRDAFSVLGYSRALADDCFAITGCIDHPATLPLN